MRELGEVRQKERTSGEQSGCISRGSQHGGQRSKCSQCGDEPSVGLGLTPGEFGDDGSMFIK